MKILALSGVALLLILLIIIFTGTNVSYSKSDPKSKVYACIEAISVHDAEITKM